MLLECLQPNAYGSRQVSRLTPYGKAWYANPELWGLDSSQVENAILDQEDDNAEGKEMKGLRFSDSTTCLGSN